MGVENVQFKSYECCIIGAGPAGLGAALELTANGTTDVLIIDKNKSIGGLSRTDVYDGVRFDIGPHRFFTKNKEVNKIWHETLKADFQPVSRLTRIFYGNKYFNYPIKPIDILTLGPAESLGVLISFIASQIKKRQAVENFEDWIIQKFGSKIYEKFFKTYTEKVWGIPCSQIKAEWAAQRIKGLDTLEIIRKMLSIRKGAQVKTLVEEFDYPVLGAGQMYEAICEKVVSRGASLMLNAKVERFNQKNNAIESIDLLEAGGRRVRIAAGQFFSSIPLTNLFYMLNPSSEGLDISYVDRLKYRDHITVNILIEGENIFPDQWIYVHSPEVQMARLANYNNFSKRMVNGKKKTALSVEYFVFKNESLWNKPDEFLGNLAISELGSMGIVEKGRSGLVSVVRESEVYPSYYMGFEEPFQLLKKKAGQLTNLYSIGRAGLYRYNNQDHSLLTGILAARNYLKLPGAPYVLWDINNDGEYQESAERYPGR